MELFNNELTLKRALLMVCGLIAALMILKIFMGLLPLAIFLFLVLAPPVYVLADAQERKVQRPILWAIFTLFTSIFGLLVYLLARPEVAGKNFCPHCGGEVDPTFHNCPWCGRSSQIIGKCKQCSTELKPGWKFCPNCRSGIEAQTPTPNSPVPSNPAPPVA